MKLFPILNKTLVSQEGRSGGYAAWDARVWPSEASAVLLDQRESQIVGKCHRASFFRLTGVPASDQIDVVAARRFVTGRLMEDDIVRLAKDAGVFVANGVKVVVSDEETGLLLPLEIDLVVLDPDTGHLGICENKTIYGWGAKKVIGGGQPKIEGLMQSVIYLNEFPTGAILKHVILEALAKRQELEQELQRLIDMGADERAIRAAKGSLKRHRVEVDFENLAKGSDGPVWTNMLYETRDDCADREFEIGIFVDDDGKHWPTVDGVPYKLFTIESIYERYHALAVYHAEAKLEAMRRVAEAGFPAPGEDVPESEQWMYRERVLEEMGKLGPEFWPPAEYEWRYSPEKIELLAEMKVISKTAYDKFKKRHKGWKHPGAWQCAFCSFKALCLSQEYPEMAHMLADLNQDDEDEAA